jgi:hypothetical protein
MHQFTQKFPKKIRPFEKTQANVFGSPEPFLQKGFWPPEAKIDGESRSLGGNSSVLGKSLMPIMSSSLVRCPSAPPWGSSDHERHYPSQNS